VIVNVAVQIRLLAGIVKLAAQGMGLQLAKVDPVSGIAVRLMVVPAA
jgi:hypothetical protein